MTAKISRRAICAAWMAGAMPPAQEQAEQFLWNAARRR